MGSEPGAELWVVSYWMPGAPTFGLVFEDGRVTEAAPVARWALGKPKSKVLDYYRRKGARVEGPVLRKTGDG